MDAENKSNKDDFATSQKDGWTHGMRARPSKLGQLISSQLSPAIMNDPKMLKTLSQYVGDSTTAADVFRNFLPVDVLAKVMKDFPKGKVLFFHFPEGSLTKDEIADFFNKSCTLVPFKIDPEKLNLIGTVPYGNGLGQEGGEKHTFYGFELDQYDPERVHAKKGKVDNDDIQAKFEEIKSGDDELEAADVSVRILAKDGFDRFFRRDRTGVDKLADDGRYLTIFAHGDEMDEDGAAKLGNDVVEGSEFVPGDVVKVGQIKQKFPGTGKFESYDVFALRLK